MQGMPLPSSWHEALVSCFGPKLVPKLVFYADSRPRLGGEVQGLLWNWPGNRSRPQREQERHMGDIHLPSLPWHR